MKILYSIIASVTLLFAQDARHIDFTQVLNGVDGKPIVNPDKSPMTLSDAAVTSLETALDEDRPADGSKQFRLDELARKVYQSKDAVLKVEEIALIKERIGKTPWNYHAVVGAAWRILDPAEKTK